MLLNLIPAFLKNNIEPILVVLLIAGLFGFGYHWGAKNERNACNIQIEAIHKAAQDATDALQAKADRIASEASKQRSESTVRAAIIQKRLKHELAKNTSYSKCIVTPELLAIYKDAAHPPSNSAR